ncbi:MAG: hypothetical protein QOK10_2903 [Pseudonocardiales bacterium]|jgi:hypothetical protein|nr:hypothetical protein [Pseudonocardiales bacterium]
MSVAPEFPPLVDIPERARRADGHRSTSARHLRLVADCPTVVTGEPVVQRLAVPATDGRRRSVRPVHASQRQASAAAVPLALTARGVRAVYVAVALLGLGMLALAYLSWSAPAPVATKAPATVTVQSGDTLWSIASEVAPHRDPRAVVDDLVARNHLVGAVLTPGQTLRLS